MNVSQVEHIISTFQVHHESPSSKLSSPCPPSRSDGVEQRSQDQEWQGVEERLGGDQEDLPNSGAAASGEGDHEERSGQEIPLLWLVSGRLHLAFSSFHVTTFDSFLSSWNMSYCLMFSSLLSLCSGSLFWFLNFSKIFLTFNSMAQISSSEYKLDNSKMKSLKSTCNFFMLGHKYCIVFISWGNG